MESVPPEVIDPTPKRPGRKAWKEKMAAGRNRNGNPIPKPASPKEAKELAKVIAADAVKAVVADKKLDAQAVEKFGAMSSTVRARILSYLGEDVEAARAEFARELLTNAREVSQHIMENFREYPPSVQAFLMTAFVDKSEQIGNKISASARGAAVGQQVNLFMDGTVDRAAIIAQLTGQAVQPADPIPVKAEPVS